MFLELAKLERKTIRLQVLRLKDALENEALDTFRLGRRLERKAWTAPEKLTQHGRARIVERLCEKHATEHVGLANTDSLDAQLDSSPARWYRQGGLLLDCAEALNEHVAVYEYLLIHRREREGGRSPSVAHDFLAAEQQRFRRSDEQVARSLAAVGFITDSETVIDHFRENVIKKHRLRWLKRNPSVTS